MIKQKFDDDVFIASKYMFNNISIYKIAAEAGTTLGCVIIPKSRPCTCQLGFNALFPFTKRDEKCQFGLTFFSRKRVKLSWYFLAI